MTNINASATVDAKFIEGCLSETCLSKPTTRGECIVKNLRPLVASGLDARQIADSSVAVWCAIDASLSPVLGQGGCAALYRRSLHLARADYPCLDAAYERASEPDAFDALRDALAQQTPEHAAAAHDGSLQTFINLLAGLIGESLTQRLLQAASYQPSSSHAIPDTSP